MPCIDVQQFPRTQIKLNVEVAVDDGSALSACVSACLVALATGGVPLLSLPIAVTCVFPCAIDPDLEDEAKGKLVLVCEQDAIVGVLSKGQAFSMGQLDQCMAAALKASHVMRGVLTQAFQASVQTNPTMKI